MSLKLQLDTNGATTYYLRSSVLGGQVAAEIQLATTGGGSLSREYVYLGGQLLALRSPIKGVLKTYWVHEDPITKSKRVTNSLGTIVSTIETDPWGADTARSNNAAFQPKKFTSYERDGNGSDETMFRRSNRWHSRFDQPDPYDGSYDSTNPQSFNRYAYVQGDPVNLIDPSGLDVPCQDVETGEWERCPDPDPANTIYTYTSTWAMRSLFGNYWLPASQGDGNRFGPVFSMPSPRDPQPSAPTPLKPAQTKPPCVHGGNGQADLGGSLGNILGLTKGLIVTPNEVHSYECIFVGGSTTLVGGSIMGRNGTDVDDGLNFSLQFGALLGRQVSSKLDWRHPRESWKNAKVASGLTTGGITLSVTNVTKWFNIPCL